MKVKIIFGAPGTGKTTKLLEILDDLSKEYSLKDIAFISFTREGVNQGKSRAKKKFTTASNEDFYFFSTLHSLAFRMLSMKKDNMINKKHYRDFSKLLGMNFTGYYTEEIKNEDDKYLFFDELYRNNMKTAINYIDTLSTSILKTVRYNYRKYKKLHEIYDFTDLIETFISNNIKVNVKAVLIDEAQDLTSLQWKMIITAFSNVDKMFIAGDDDQAIFTWAGSDVEYFLSLQGEIEILSKTYRLPAQLFYFAKKISNRIEHRVNKNISCISDDGSIDFIYNLEDIKNQIQEWILNNESVVFLARNRAFFKYFEYFLKKHGFVYYIDDCLSIDYQEYRYIELYENSKNNDEITDYRLYDVLKTIKNTSSVTWQENFKWDYEKKDYYTEVLKNNKSLDTKIYINTIHRVKGDEYDNVIICSDMTKTTYNNYLNNADSEHRCFYVAITRAKKRVYILQNNTKYYYNFLGY